MQKMISLFARGRTDKGYLATRKVTPGAEWVIAGEGRVMEKFDGFCCAVIDGVFHCRHRIFTTGKTLPPGWRHWSGDPAAVSGYGWIPVGDSNGGQCYRNAWQDAGYKTDGTYELVGPRVKKNPYALAQHQLWRHGSLGNGTTCDQGELNQVGRSFDELREFLVAHRLEGLVFHHSDHQMIKIKRRDFEIRWP